MKVHLKVWTTDFAECETFVLSCQPMVRDELVSRFVTDLKLQFPGNEFRVVHLGKGRYNVCPTPIANA